VASLPALIVLTRDAIAQKFTRDWSFWQRQADPSRPVDVGPKTMPSILGRVVADILLPVSANAVTIANATLVGTATGDRLAAIGQSRGVLPHPATGATGYVQISAAQGGGVIVEGDELVDANTGLRFQVLVTQLYANGAQVPIQAIDTGPATNLAAGTLLVFSSPRPGIGAKTTIVPQANGSGLSGGHDVETDSDYAARIIEQQSNPPASGNGAEYIRETENTPGVPVEKAWVIPAWAGPGTTCVVFTVRPDQSGGSRTPNPIQLGQVEANLKALFPGDDSITLATVLPLPLTVAVSVSWRKNAAGWTDNQPWPPFVWNAQANPPAFAPVAVDGSAAPTSATLRATTTIATAAPQPGQTLAVYNLNAGIFQRKKVLTVAPVVMGMSWDLTFDTTNGASDLYVPTVGQLVSPWSDSLNQLPAAVVAYMLGLGPGEQFATFADPGVRGRREPESPTSWPSTIGNADLVTAIKATPPVSDVTLRLPSTTPYPTPIGVPGVLVNLFTLGDLAAFVEG
jgi:hypothetical protein